MASAKFQEIMDYIQQQVDSGVYRLNQKLPTEHALAQQFQTSRPTVVKALDRLRDMGIICRVQGSGSYVNQSYVSAAKAGSNIISVILPFAGYRNVARMDEVNILKGIDRGLSQHGFFTMIRYCNDESNSFISTITSVKNSPSVGIIAYVAKDLLWHDGIYTHFSDNIPFVLLDQPIIGLDLPCVRSDNAKGSQQAIDHLVGCGYDVIYFLTDVNLASNESIRERYIGFCQAMQQHRSRAEFGHIMLVTQNDVEVSPKEVLMQIREKHVGKRIGIFATGDYFASRIFDACMELGYRVPEEVGIMGFDGLGFTLQGNRRLSTITQDFYKIGKLAAQAMLKQLSEPGMVPETIRVDVELQIGDTTAPH